MVFKSLNNLAPQYMTSMFKYVDNNINARNCLRVYKQGDLQIPAGIHKMVFVNSFAYNSVNMWNQINLEVTNFDSLSSFNAGYLRHHFNGFN